jgi:hypothetical protein
MATSNKIVAVVCMYGNHGVGTGWLATLPDGRLLGDGELTQGNFTDSLHLAARALKDAGTERGVIRVFDAGGRYCADVELSKIRYYGDLNWLPAPVVTISAEDLIAAAEAQGHTEVAAVLRDPIVTLTR